MFTLFVMLTLMMSPGETCSALAFVVTTVFASHVVPDRVIETVYVVLAAAGGVRPRMPRIRAEIPIEIRRQNEGRRDEPSVAFLSVGTIHAR